MNKVTIRRLMDEDIALFKKWVYLPHVAQWYEHPLSWIDEIEKRTNEYHWINHFIAMCDEKPIGFCQYYEYLKSGEDWHGTIELEGTYSIDYMIGEADYLNKGFGKEIVKNLIQKIREHSNARRIIVQPEEANKVSCNTLRSCGFEYVESTQLYLLIL